MHYGILFSFCFISSSVFARVSEESPVINQNEVIKIIGGLFLVLLLIVFLSWIVKRLHLINLSTSKGFQSLASITLGPKEKIVLLRVGERYLLLGTGSVNLVHDFGEQMPTGFGMDSKTGFAEILNVARMKRSVIREKDE